MEALKEALKEAGKAMERIVKIDLDSGFQMFLTIAHSEKHISLSA